MQINLTTPAILFPTISLFMLAYTNRFSALVSRIRELSEKCDENRSEAIIKQISYLEKRVKLVILMQAFLIVSTLLCVLSMIFLVFDINQLGEWLFLLSLIAIVASLLISFLEINISGKALKIQLESMKAKMK